MKRFTLEIVECPECASPTEIVDRFVLESTNGPIEHAIRTRRNDLERNARP